MMSHNDIFRNLNKKWNLKTYQNNLAIQQVETQDDKKFWLKAFTTKKECQDACSILKHYAGRGSVLLIDHYNNYQLLEDISPGERLTEVEDKLSISVLIELVNKLHETAKEDLSLPNIKDWALGFDQNIASMDTIGKRLFDHGKGIYHDLLQEQDSWTPLHGDLHHKNILSAKNQPWVAIDPKGVLGPIEYEYGCFLRNPVSLLLSHDNSKKFIQDRLSHIAEQAQLEKEKLRLWAFSQAILASLWAIEDNIPIWRDFLDIAKLYNSSFV